MRIATKKTLSRPISKDQARDLGRSFLEVAHALGTYRFAHWNDLSAADRKRIEDEEWDLPSFSSSLTTKAVGAVLSDLQGDLTTISAGATRATKTIGTIREVKVVLKIAAAFVALGGAIVSGNAVAITSAAAAAAAATGALEASKGGV